MFILAIPLSILAMWTHLQKLKNKEKSFKMFSAYAWAAHVIIGFLSNGYITHPIFLFMIGFSILFVLSETLFVHDYFELGLAGYLIGYIFLSIGFYTFNFDFGLFIAGSVILIPGIYLLTKIKISLPVVLYLIVLTFAFMFACATKNIFFILALSSQYLCDFRLGLEKFGKEQIKHNEILVMACQYATFLFLGL